MALSTKPILLSGHGVIYQYDVIGSKERVRATCSGKGSKMLQSFLDEVTDMEKDEALWEVSPDEGEFVSHHKDIYTQLSKDEAIALAVRAFEAAAEREISVGDGLQVMILTKSTNTDNEHSMETQHFRLPSH